MSDVTISAKKNGPFRVEGPVRLLDVEGKEYDLTGKTGISLCRCGHSNNKPFCDGSHNKASFQSAETAPPKA